MTAMYTSGDWYVKPGRESEFVQTWRELAEWSLASAAGSRWARLLRDEADPRHFVSFGPWESREAIEAWRAMPGFQERVGRLRELLESFEPRTLELVGEVGEG